MKSKLYSYRIRELVYKDNHREYKIERRCTFYTCIDFFENNPALAILGFIFTLGFIAWGWNVCATFGENWSGEQEEVAKTNLKRKIEEDNSKYEKEAGIFKSKSDKEKVVINRIIWK